jgi:replication factor A1
MQAPRLTSGAVKEIAELPKGLGTIQPVLQVADVRPITAKSAAGSDRFRMLVSDGVHSLQSMLSTDLNRFVTDGTLRLGSIVHLLEVMCSDIQGRRSVRHPAYITRILSAPPHPHADVSRSACSARKIGF